MLGRQQMSSTTNVNSNKCQQQQQQQQPAPPPPPPPPPATLPIGLQDIDEQEAGPGADHARHVITHTRFSRPSFLESNFTWGLAGSCSPRHHTHFRPSFLELKCHAMTWRIEEHIVHPGRGPPRGRTMTWTTSRRLSTTTSWWGWRCSLTHSLTLAWRGGTG